MARSESVEFYLRFLQERSSSFRASRDDFLRELTQESAVARKVDAAKEFYQQLDHLRQAISAQDRPGWIDVVEKALLRYIDAAHGGGNAGLNLLKVLLQNHSAIEHERWDFVDATEAVEFDSVYEKHYQQSVIPKLFDDLVLQLQRLVECGAVETVQALRAVEKLIATIKRNAKGDYFATRSTWEYARTFATNLAFEVADAIPGVKQVVRAMRKTLSDLDMGWRDLHKSIRLDLSKAKVADLPLLEYKPPELPEPDAIAFQGDTASNTSDAD